PSDLIRTNVGLVVVKVDGLHVLPEKIIYIGARVGSWRWTSWSRGSRNAHRNPGTVGSRTSGSCRYSRISNRRRRADRTRTLNRDAADLRLNPHAHRILRFPLKVKRLSSVDAVRGRPKSDRRRRRSEERRVGKGRVLR